MAQFRSKRQALDRTEKELAELNKAKDVAFYSLKSINQKIAGYEAVWRSGHLGLATLGDHQRPPLATLDPDSILRIPGIVVKLQHFEQLSNQSSDLSHEMAATTTGTSESCQ